MQAPLTITDASDWSYRGEGAVNLVLAYTGTSPAFVGKVMRIQKVSRNDKSFGGVLTEEEKMIWREVEELVNSPTKEIADQVYVHLVMSPLLGSNHVDPGVRVAVSREFLEFVDENVKSERPPWRVDAAMVDLNRDSVILMSDHSVFPSANLNGGSCLSVEIKPKCGFLPLSRFIADANAIKKSLPRFRLHQILKLGEQKITELSQYNPLDLFSGSKERIQKAIKDLHCTPQNNFRVFTNGSLLFGGLGGGTEKTSTSTEEAFEHSLNDIIHAEDGLRTSSFIYLVAEVVYRSRVLDQLLEVQKLDKLDIEGAIHAYYNVVTRPCAICQELDDIGIPNRWSSLHSITIEESLKIVKDYLVAATAKDCSVMISFRPIEDGSSCSDYSSVFLESTNQTFEYKVNFIDLDMKPLKKMEDYYELDKKIVKCYSETANT